MNLRLKPGCVRSFIWRAEVVQQKHLLTNRFAVDFVNYLFPWLCSGVSLDMICTIIWMQVSSLYTQESNHK